MFADAYAGKRVFITGHTGFQGSWLSLWLAQLGAHVTGYGLPPRTAPSLFEDAAIAGGVTGIVGDIRDGAKLRAALTEARPDFIFHLAAQRDVFLTIPEETFAINAAGPIALMEAIRQTGTRAAVVMVTTAKVYRQAETGAPGDLARPFREDDPLGGHDPYGASKAATEIAVAAWRNCFFAAEDFSQHGVRVATARIGNVIGGGDWSVNRIVPDLARALIANTVPRLSQPGVFRSWQHVLEPLAGYLWLGAQLAAGGGASFAEGWNFGPDPEDQQPVCVLAEAMMARWGRVGWAHAGDPAATPKAPVPRLAIDKAGGRMGWWPVWNFKQTINRTADWYRQVHTGKLSARAMCEADIAAFCAAAAVAGAAFAA